MRRIGTDNYVNVFYARRTARGWDYNWEWTELLMKEFYKFFKYEEKKGYKWNPVEVDTILQLVAVNDLNLNQEYLDATIAVSMQWYDPRLMWDKDKNGMVQTIRARLDEVWTPELLIVNRIHDFPKVDENVPKCKKKYFHNKKLFFSESQP